MINRALFIRYIFPNSYCLHSPSSFLYKNNVTAWRTKGGIMALSLSASAKVDESPWSLSVEGGCFGKAISLDIRNSHPYD